MKSDKSLRLSMGIRNYREENNKMTRSGNVSVYNIERDTVEANKGGEMKAVFYDLFYSNFKFFSTFSN